MKVVDSIAVDESIIISTNVVEDDAPEWAAGTTYADKDRVILSAEKSVYESVQGANTGNSPNEASSAYWVRVMSTKPYRAFDGILSAPLSQDGAITYVIEPTQLIRVVGLIGVSALEATVEVRNGDNEIIISRTQNLTDYSELIDAVSMVTIEPSLQENTVFEGMICQPGNTLHITIGDGNGSASVSEIVIGDVIPIGGATFGTEVGIDDFSRFEEDQFGNVDIVQRGYRDFTNFEVVVQTASIRRLRRRLAAIRAKFSLFYFADEGQEDFGTTVLGKYDKLSTIIAGPQVSDMQLRITGAVYNGV